MAVGIARAWLSYSWEGAAGIWDWFRDRVVKPAWAVVCGVRARALAPSAWDRAVTVDPDRVRILPVMRELTMVLVPELATEET